MSVAVPYVPGVTPEAASCVEPTPPGAMLSVTLAVSWPPPVMPVPAITCRVTGTPATDNKSPTRIW